MLIVVPDVQHALLLRILSDFLIQFSPVGPVLFRIDLMIQPVQFRMMLMNPLENALPVVTPQIQVFEPDKVAPSPDPLDDFHQHP